MVNRYLFVAVIAIALVAGFSWGIYQRKPSADLQNLSATVLTPPKSINEFSLVDQHQKAFTLDSLQDKWSFVFFGYTHCPDICPTTLSTMSQAHQILSDEGHEDQTVVFVSVDPKRDSVEKLANYMPYFNPSFTGVTGELNQIDQLTKQLGILYFHQGEGENYLVDHSASLLLIDPSARLRAVFSPPFEPQKLAKEFEIIKTNS